MEVQEAVNAYAEDETVAGAPVTYADVLGVYRAHSRGSLNATPVAVQDADLSVSLSKQSVASGDSILVNYTITNRGSQDALVTGVELDVPSGLTFEQHHEGGNAYPSQQSIVFSEGIDAGESKTVTQIYTVADSADGSVTLSGTATVGDQTTTDSETLDVSTDGAAPSEPVDTEIVAAQPNTATLSPGESQTVTYELTNPSDIETSVLVEFPTLPENITLQSFDGAVSQDLSGSAPPGLISTPIAPDSTASVQVTFAVPDTAAATNETVDAEATVRADSTTTTDTASTTLEITTVDPVVHRFGGDDGDVDNLDVLQAVNAANNNEEIGGEPVDNLDILQVVNRVN